MSIADRIRTGARVLLAPLAAATVLLAGERSAGATGEVGRAIQDPLSRISRVGLQQDISQFDVPQARGTRYTLALRGDWAPIPILSLRVRAPAHRVWLSDGDVRSGFGDAELRLKVRVLDVGGYILVQAGVIETLPTGSRAERLGNGAMVVTPFVTAGRKFGKTVLYAYVSDAIALRRQNAKRYEDLTDPSADHEARSAIGLLTTVSSVVSANISLSAITILTPSQLGETFVHGGPLVALATSDATRVVIGAQLPIVGERRFDWRGTLDAYFFF